MQKYFDNFMITKAELEIIKRGQFVFGILIGCFIGVLVTALTVYFIL